MERLFAFAGGNRGEGSKRLLEQYGDKLLCMRFRYDERRRLRLKTVEIIAEERPWPLPPFQVQGWGAGASVEARIPAEFLNGSRKLWVTYTGDRKGLF